MGYIVFLFFLSGICGLVYEVVWTRMLNLVFGNTTFSVTTVLAAYMAGLALGSITAGKFIDKKKNLLFIYGLLEFFIGVSALILPYLLSAAAPFYKTAFLNYNASFFQLSVIRFLISFMILMIPTTLMGATLPVLSRVLINSYDSLGRRIGLLYALNTLGAVLGCFLAGFILIANFGVSASVKTAASLNIIVAILAIRLNYGKNYRPVKVAGQKDREAGGKKFPRRVIFAAAAVFGISGFASLGYEIVWTRYLGFVFTSSIYSFTVMLMVFLTGIALGSLVFSRLVDREKNLTLLLSIIQVCIGLFSVVAIHTYRLFYYFFDRFLALDIASVSIAEFTVTAGYFFIIIFPVTFFMGAVFPVVSKICTNNISKVGSITGNIYFINTLGSILGSVITGFLLIPLIGTQNTLGVFIVINICLCVYMLYPDRQYKKFNGKLVIGMSALLLIFGLASTFYNENIFVKMTGNNLNKFFSNTEARVLSHFEDVEASVSVFEERNGRRSLWINGLVVTCKCLDTKLMAHLPIMMVKDPKDMLVLCFGMGSTYTSASSHDLNVDVVEIVPSVVSAFKYFNPDSEKLLKKPGNNVIINDARNYLFLTGKKYDVITMDPSPPIYSAGSVNLYTPEFFTKCRERLNEGGLMCLWIPLCKGAEYRLILKSFNSVFYTTVWNYYEAAGTFVIGSKEKLVLDGKLLKERFKSKALVSDTGENKVKLGIIDLEKNFLFDDDLVREYVKDTKLMTDDMPYIEYPLLKWRDSVWYAHEKFFIEKRSDVRKIIKY